VITIKGIDKSFGGLKAVDECSLGIQKGSITGLIGPNGAGKSTLFDIISGFTRPDKGKVFLEDEDITAMPPHKLFHKGLMRTFQIPHEFDRMTTLENLLLVPANQTGEGFLTPLYSWNKVLREEQEIRKQAEEVLEFLNIAQVRDELAGNLSGGQKKLLELGRTMMANPAMVLLDEPGAGVNRTLLATLAEDISKLNRERGYTFCIIEHDMDFVKQLCDPIIVMAQGSVLAQGSMQDIRGNKEVQEAYLGVA
jgi:branched-chain amino acid transport system ATP-binding protein